MRRLLVFLVVLASTGGHIARAGEPPNQHDPCAKAGKDSCGTTGKGSYRTYRYGVRWFGDYRGVVDGVDGGTFCIDLRYWYPSSSFDYEARSAAGLKNRDGKAISSTSLHRMSRALWRFGRSNDPDQQAAVMLYVHTLMGDGAPGEADPKALSASSRTTFAAVQRDASLYAGPYKVRAVVPDKLVSGKAAAATVEVLSASGRRVPNVGVALAVDGGTAPATVNTGSGTAKFAVTAGDAATLSVEARASSLPADLPQLYVPTKGESARNAQRVIAPLAASPKVTVQAAVRAQPALTTAISAQTTAPGSALTDTIHVTGLGQRAATIEASLYGPFASRDAIKCDGTPVWSGTVAATGDGDYVTDAFTVPAPGYYTYHEAIAASDTIEGVETACADAAETTIAPATPRGQYDRQRGADRARRAAHGHTRGDRVGHAPGDGQCRALGAVRDAGCDRVHRHAGLVGHGRGGRRRDVHDGAVHARERGLLRLPRVDRGL